MIYKLNEEYFVRTLQEEDVLGDYPKWFEDQDVCRYNSHGKYSYSKNYFENYVKNLNGSHQIIWAICHVIDGHIGNISLQEISFINRTAEFAIILGNKAHWGKKVGFLAGKKLLEHGFFKLDLEKIHCGTAVSNEGMKKLALSLGMVLEGVRRRHFFLEGCRVDLVEYGILRNEFIELKIC